MKHQVLKTVLLAILCSDLTASVAWAQDLEALEGRICGVPAIPIRSSLSVGVGHGAMRDTYMTPLLYEGAAIGVHYERSRSVFSCKGGEKVHWLYGSFSQGQIASGNSASYAGRLHYSFARLLCVRQFSVANHSFVYAFGPYVGADLGFNYNLKMAAGNNPATVRCTANAGASGMMSTSYRFFGQQAMLMLQVQTPLLGAALVPEYGASYYETFYLNHTDHDMHFTSLHNQQDLDVRLMTSLPTAVFPRFRRYTTQLRLGAAYHIETMDVNHIITRYSTFEFVVGWSWCYNPCYRK